MPITRGIREIPTKIDPSDPQLRQVLVDLREAVVAMQPSRAPLGAPSNFKVTAQPFGNLLQWTRAPNADYYEVLWNTTPNAVNANLVDAGNSAQFVDSVGQVGITRYYWVRSRNNAGVQSKLVGPVKGTTLASAAGVNPPAPPPAGQQIITDQQLGHQVPNASGGTQP